MTPEQQRIAIAEACGWKSELWGDGVTRSWINPSFCYAELPDYLTDLNAMHGAEKVLTKRQVLEYQVQIYRVASASETFDGGYASWHYIHATAAQRAEAFLRTIGKWVES